MDSGSFTVQVGDIRCVSILDDRPRYPVAMFLRNVSRSVYAPLLDARGQDPDVVDLPFICMLVVTARHRILIDTGGGRDANRPASGQLLPMLRAQNVEPEQIDLVVLTHAHGDHVRGCLDAHGRPAFPNARYILAAREWDFWMSEPSLDELPVDASFKQRMLTSVLTNLRGIAAQIDLVQPDVEVVAGITLLDTPGHTAGHMAVEIASGGERLLFVGDALVLPLQIELPETIGVTDHRPDQVIAARRGLLQRAVQHHSIVAASHFPFPGLGRIDVGADGFKWTPLDPLNAKCVA